MYKLVVLSVMISFLGITAQAEYCATGKFEAQECTSYGIFESCKNVQIDAVRDSKGNLFKVKECWANVDEYKFSENKKSLCWLYTKSKGLGLLNYAINGARLPDFLHKKNDGKYEKIAPDYLVFQCEKR